MKILLTNDDGIHSDGIKVLSGFLRKIANVYVVAPDTERSAVGVSLSLHKPLRLKEIEKNVFISDGTPVDCVDLGLAAVLKNHKPDLVVSGINSGPNIAEDVFYSGTVGAILEARMRNVSGLAVSMFSDANNNFNYSAAAETAVIVINQYFKKLKKNEIRTFNLNIPAVTDFSEIKGIKLTKLDRRTYPGGVITRKDPRGSEYYWIGGGKPDRKNIKDSDYNALSKKYASLTPLQLDITDYDFIKKNNKRSKLDVGF